METLTSQQFLIPLQSIRKLPKHFIRNHNYFMEGVTKWHHAKKFCHRQFGNNFLSYTIKQYFGNYILSNYWYLNFKNEPSHMCKHGIYLSNCWQGGLLSSWGGTSADSSEDPFPEAPSGTPLDFTGNWKADTTQQGILFKLIFLSAPRKQVIG